MSTALQTVQSDAIQPFFTSEQEHMILTQFLGGASKAEAAVLLEIVKRRRLDPFSRQVYFVKRWDSQKKQEVWAIQTSIDGLRSIAERTGKYDGQDEPVYGEDEAGKFCKVRVYRKDWSPNRYAMGIAYLNEFVQLTKSGEVTKFWREKPRLMLAKCAEALAIRKAFPEDSAGLYINEEMPEERHHEVVRGVPAESSPSPRAALAPAATPGPEEGGVLSPGEDPPAMTPEVVEPLASETDKVLKDIAKATTRGALLVLVPRIKLLPSEDIAMVREAYAAKQKEMP
jgi:phage recombination protein Bet